MKAKLSNDLKLSVILTEMLTVRIYSYCLHYLIQNVNIFFITESLKTVVHIK